MIAALAAPCDPVRPNTGLAQRLINTGLIGAERATTLQQQGNDFEGKMPLSCCETRRVLNVHEMLSKSMPDDAPVTDRIGS